MKENSNILRRFFLTAFLIVIGTCLGLAKEGPARVYMYLNYYNESGQTYLEAQLKYKVEKAFHLLEGEEITFSSLNGDKVKIGTFVTNSEGKAICPITNDTPVFRDTSGLMQFTASYKGSQEYKKAKKSLDVVEIELSLTTEEVDSVKTLKVVGYEIISDSLKIPLTDVSVLYSVKRLFGDMIIGEEEMKKGKTELVFPSDIPGDQYGNVLVSAGISNHDLYGNVKTSDEVSWGTVVSYENEALPRALWSKAPLWMIIAMIVVLGGAWYHYFLALFKMLKIRKS